jgi:hypothetical protein
MNFSAIHIMGADNSGVMVTVEIAISRNEAGMGGSPS